LDILFLFPKSILRDNKQRKELDMLKRTMIAVLAAVMFSTAALHATETENFGIRALPAPAEVQIDGKVDDWDLSGGIFACGDAEVLRERIACWFHLAYDADNLYVLARWVDEDPRNNPGSTAGDHGFAGDCLQFRIVTANLTPQERCAHVSAWYGNKNRKHVIDMAYGKSFNAGGNLRDAQTAGARQAFRVHDDNRGYNQEIALPWKLLTKDGKALQAGNTFVITVEPNFSAGVGGRISVKDIFKPGVTIDRVFTFMGHSFWGVARMEAKGYVNPQPVRLEDAREFEVRMEDGVPMVDWTGLIKSRKLLGHKVIEFDMPADGYVSMHIKNAEGTVVRQLLNCEFRTRGRHETRWDGLSTPNLFPPPRHELDPGDPLPPGEYTWSGIYHGGIGLRLRGWACNGGRAPWDDGTGTSNWGGDHGVPSACVTDGTKVYLGWTGAEAGKAMVAVDLDGKAQWLHRRGGMGGAPLAAVDGGIVYCVDGHRTIFRLNSDRGTYSEWAGSELATRDVASLWAGRRIRPGTVSNITAKDGKLYLSFTGHNMIAVLDGSSGKLLKTFTVQAPSHMHAVDGGPVYVNSAGRSILALDPVTGETTAVIAGLLNAAGVTADAQGNIYVATGRPDHQVKVFAADGAEKGAIGRKGGRPALGPWVADGMLAAHGIVVDPKGQLWVMEADSYPKRVSVWDTRTHKLTREYFGPTHYGASGAAISVKDPTVMVGEGCEWKMDPATGRSVCVGAFERQIRGFARFCYGPGGREYVSLIGSGPIKVYERLGPADYKLRAVITTGQNTTFWSDENGDEKEQPGEITTIHKRLTFGGYGGGTPYPWSMNMNHDFTLYSGNGPSFQIKVSGFTSCHAPKWDPADAVELPPLMGPLSSLDNKLVVSCDGSSAWIKCYDTATGKLRWTYPNSFMGVHGSHKAPPPRGGLLRGVFGFVGSANLPSPVGDIWAMNSNVGEWHVLTGEGYYLTRLFQGDPLKVSFPEKAVPGAILDNAPPGLGGEDFGGSLTQAKDGKVYAQSGKTGIWNVEVVGLDTVKTLGRGKIRIEAGDLAKAKEFRELYLQKDVGIRSMTAAKLTPEFTGNIAADFKVEEPVAFQKLSAAAVKVAVAWDDTNLYLGYDVNDPVPWVNNAGTADGMYASGDTVDFQVGTDPEADRDRDTAVLGDLRLSIGSFQGKPTAVIYRKVAKKKAPKTYNSGVFKDYVMESVIVVEGAEIVVTPRANGYVVEAAIPLKALGIEPAEALALRGDFGVTHGDPWGTDTVLRTYWNNQETGIVNDDVAELMMTPANWGQLVFRE